MELKEAYLLYHKKILSLAFHQLGSVEEAEEVTQEVFMKYDRYAHKETITNLRGWLYRVAYNRCMDRHRFFSRVKKGLQNLTGKTVESPEVEVSIKDELAHHLNKLSPKEKMVVLLKYLDGLNYVEMAEIMNMEVGTLKSIVSRSLNKMSQEI